MFENLDRRYALDIYEVAEEKGKVQEYLNDLREICDLIDNNKDFYEVVKHPQISTKQKKKTFINIFKGNIDEELLSFLLIYFKISSIQFILVYFLKFLPFQLDTILCFILFLFSRRHPQ